MEPGNDGSVSKQIKNALDISVHLNAVSIELALLERQFSW